MSFRIAINLLRLVLLLITIQCVTPVFAKAQSRDYHRIIAEHKSDHTSLFSAVLFEKMEEEKKSEEEKGRFLTIELLDFSTIRTLLSQAHTPDFHISLVLDRFDLQPPLFTLFCVFLI